MKSTDDIEMIQRLSEAPGVSGFEDAVLSEIRQAAAGLGNITEDSLRNLYLHRRGNREGLPVVQLDAHTDEVGFMIKAVRPNGMLEFIPLGTWVPANVPAHRVLVRNDDGVYIPGIVASTPPHFLSEAERKAPPELSAMVIDLGASSAEEVAEDYRVSIAAPVIPEAVFQHREPQDTIIGKAFDCRLGCAAVISTLQELAGEDLEVNLTAAFSAQEEVGIRGAKITARAVQPDIALVFEGCPADDTVVAPYASQTALKKGPMLRHIDTWMITNPRFQRFALEAARRQGIPVQEAVRSGGATNGAAIHLSGRGVPVVVLGIPVRYPHTHYGISSLEDYRNTVEIACALLRTLSREVIAGF